MIHPPSPPPGRRGGWEGDLGKSVVWRKWSGLILILLFLLRVLLFLPIILIIYFSSIYIVYFFLHYFIAVRRIYFLTLSLFLQFLFFLIILLLTIFIIILNHPDISFTIPLFDLNLSPFFINTLILIFLQFLAYFSHESFKF